MSDRERLAEPGEGGRDLHPAARVGGHHHVGPRVEHRPGLALTELPRRTGVQQVVRAGAAAADLRLDDLPQLDAGDRTQQPTWLVAYALRVGQVARVLVGHSHRQRVALGDGPELVEQLGDVAGPGGEGLGALRPARLVTQLMGVLLQVGAAPRGVRHDGLDIRSLEGLDDPLGEVDRLALPAGVRGERTAAALLRWDDDLAALRGQDPHGRGVHVGEEGPLHAAGEQPDRAAAGALGRGADRQSLDGPEPWGERFHRLQALGQARQQAAAGKHPAQAAGLVGA